MRIKDSHIVYGILTPIMLIFLSWALLSFILPDAYADETFEEPVQDVFTWLGEMFADSINNSGLPEDTQNNLHDTLDAGIEAGHVGTSLWFKIHSFLVALIFTGASEAGYDESIKNLIVWVAMFAVFGMMIGIAKKLLHENAKIATIVIGILIILGVLGIVIEF